jgi:hypothetical protein
VLRAGARQERDTDPGENDREHGAPDRCRSPLTTPATCAPANHIEIGTDVERG